MKQAKRFRAIGLALAAGMLPLAVLAHDTWLVPSSFRPQAGATIKLSLATSESFPTSDSKVQPERVARFAVRTAAGEQRVSPYALEGFYLVGNARLSAGHAIAVAELSPNLIKMKAEEFNEYLGHEELKHVIEARAAAGKTDTMGREMYRKIAKAAICVGASLNDTVYAQPFGLWLEIVPERSPCGLTVGDALTVRVLFQGKPLAGAHVAAGYEGVTGHSYPAWIPTDKNGRATVKLDRPGAWFVRTLHMVALENDENAEWESAFSTLTFEVAPAPAGGAAGEIRRLLDEQATAWNRGDIESFVAGYWKSDLLTFVGTGGVTRGWAGLLERYKRAYPGRAAMGQLSFSDLEVTPLGAEAALVLGRWRLVRERDTPGGIFTLVVRKLPEGWRVVHDHTSSDD